MIHGRIMSYTRNKYQITLALCLSLCVVSIQNSPEKSKYGTQTRRITSTELQDILTVQTADRCTHQSFWRDPNCSNTLRGEDHSLPSTQPIDHMDGFGGFDNHRPLFATVLTHPPRLSLLYMFLFGAEYLHCEQDRQCFPI